MNHIALAHGVLDHGVLDHNHRVGALGQGSARHDLDRLARANRPFERTASPGFANHPKISGEIDRMNGKAITSGAGKRGIVPIGLDILRQHTPGRIEQSHLLRRDALLRLRSRFAKDAGAGLFEGQRHYV